MKSLTIKNLEDGVVAALTAKAELEGQSVQEYLRRLLARDARMTSPVVLLERQRRAMAEGLDGAERARLLERVHASQRSALQQLLDSVPAPR